MHLRPSTRASSWGSLRSKPHRAGKRRYGENGGDRISGPRRSPFPRAGEARLRRMLFQSQIHGAFRVEESRVIERERGVLAVDQKADFGTAEDYALDVLFRKLVYNL